MNGADRLCDVLLANGIDVCFANPGTSEMHFVAALDRKSQMRCVLGLFEGVVTGAADGYARMADKPAATLLHLGPGLGNGLANLHNARRARTPMVNIVGDHATYHRQYDAPLTSDIEGIARPVSDFVRSIARAEDLQADTQAAIQAACAAPGIATLILPADAAWSDLPDAPIVPVPRLPARAVDRDLYDRACEALRAGRQVALLLGGMALRASSLTAAGRIAAATRARLFAQTANARVERGAGRVPISRIPYRVEAAVAALADIEVLIVIGADVPANFFAYPGKPSQPMRPDCDIIELAGSDADLPELLARLADAVGERSIVPAAASQPLETPRSGPLTGEAVSRVVASLLPEGAIVCDESITAGAAFYGASAAGAPHDFLELTGGAIGIGIPLATGASVACPDRKVICLQADGSGMYTNQGLWTQARENLDVLTIVFANASYATLHGEMRAVGVAEMGRNAKRMLNLDEPRLDWVSLARSMGVEGGRADTVERFTSLLEAGLAHRGPFLIEAVI